MSLLEPELLRRLERRRLASRRAPTALGPGERRSRSRGRSMEFAEHRDYAPGDDIRHLDWNVYARLDKLCIKLFLEEKEQTVTLLLDGSASMRGGKLEFARRLAAALGYVALGSYDRVGVGLLRERLAEVRSPVRGRSQAAGLFAFLEQVEAGGQTDLNAALSEFGRRFPRPGQVLVISDFLQPGAGLEGLSQLRYQKNLVTLLQVLEPEELDPSLTGDLKLIDVESSQARELTVTHSLLKAYRHSLDQLCGSLRDWANRHGCAYLLVNSHTDLVDLVSGPLQRQGVFS